MKGKLFVRRRRMGLSEKNQADGGKYGCIKCDGTIAGNTWMYQMEEPTQES